MSLFLASGVSEVSPRAPFYSLENVRGSHCVLRLSYSFPYVKRLSVGEAALSVEFKKRKKWRRQDPARDYSGVKVSF